MPNWYKKLIPMSYTCVYKLKLISRNKATMNQEVKKAVKKVREVGLNVYLPKSKDTGFIKLYRKRIVDLVPKINGNSLKVLLILASELEWNDPEVCVSMDRLVKLTGLTRITIKACLDELERNLVVKRLGPNIRRSYTVSDHYVRLGKNK